MCGRALCSLRREAYAQVTGIQDWQDPSLYVPSYNLAPGAWLPVIRLTKEGVPEVQSMKWGLVPSFHKTGDKMDHWRMFNARSETIHTSPVFRRLLTHKRCVVLLNGFYEWKAEGANRKQPYYIYRGDSPTASSPAKATASSPAKGAAGGAEEKLLAVAGLWDVSTQEDGQPLYTVTLITCDSCDSLTWLHDRMPVFLDGRAAVEAWLGASLPEGCTLFDDEEEQQHAPLEGQKMQEPKQHETQHAHQHAEQHTQHVKQQETESQQRAGGRKEDAQEVKSEPQQGTEPAQDLGMKVEGKGEIKHAKQQQQRQQRQGAAVASPQGDTVEHERAVKEEDVVKDERQPSTSQAHESHEPHESHESHAGHHGKEEAHAGEDIMQLIKQVCRPYHGPLAWHPVTPEMTKMSYQSPDACADVRTRKGTISSFFAAKPKATTAPAAATAQAGKDPAPVKAEQAAATSPAAKRKLLQEQGTGAVPVNADDPATGAKRRAK